MNQREVYCGVPQGSVFRSLLWNLAYDADLRTSLPSDLGVAYYSDDTLILTIVSRFGFRFALPSCGPHGTSCKYSSRDCPRCLKYYYPNRFNIKNKIYHLFLMSAIKLCIVQ